MNERDLLVQASYTLQSIREKTGLPELLSYPSTLEGLVLSLIEIDCALARPTKQRSTSKRDSAIVGAVILGVAAICIIILIGLLIVIFR